MKRGKKFLRIGGRVLAALLILVIAVTLFVYFHKPTVKNYLERTLSKKAGLTVKIGRLNYRAFPFRIEADSIKILFTGEWGRADVWVGRTEARGGLARLIKKQKPVFDSLAVSGMKLEFFGNAKSPSSGPFNLREAARGISDYLEEVGSLTVKDSSFHFLLPGEGTDVSASGVDLKAEGAARTSIEWTAAKIDIRNDSPRVSFASGLKGEMSWSRTGPFSLGGTFELIDSSVSLPDKEWAETGFSVKAGFQADEKSVVVSAFSLDLPGQAALSGSGRAEWGRPAMATISAKLIVKNIESLRKRFAPLLPPDLPVFFIDGEGEAEGEVRLERASGPLKISVNGTVRLPSSHFIMKRTGLSIDQILRVELHVEGAPADLQIRGLIEGRQGRLTAGSFQAKGFSFHLPVEFSGNRMDILSLKARADEVVLSVGTRQLKLDGVSIDGKTNFDFLNQAADIASLAIDVPRLGDFTLAGKLSFKTQTRFQLALGGRSLEIGAIGEYFSAFLPEALTAWQPKGQADLSLEIGNSGPDFRRYRVQGAANLSQLTFRNSSESIVSEGLEPRLEFDADILSFDQPIPFSARFELASGESLWNDVYLNWRNEPVRMDLKGTLVSRIGLIRDVAATVHFPPLGEAQIRGSLGLDPNPHFDFHMTAMPIELAPLVAFMGRVRSQPVSPWEIRGTAETEIHVRLGASFSVEGNVKVHETKAALGDGSLILDGLEVDFPLSITNRFRMSGEKENFFFAPGHIRIKQIHTSIGDLDPVSLDFFSAENLFLFFPAEIGLWGARFELGKSVVSVSPFSLGIKGFSTLSLADLDLALLPFNSENFKLAGRAAIPSMKLEIQPGESRFTGPLLADIYGGRLTLDDIGITEIFSPGRRISLRADIAGLDLKKLTDSVPFGAVTGIVDVSVRDFVLSYGQPEYFTLSIVSVPQKGFPRTFSLKAVDNLSLISSAGTSGIPSNNFFLKLVPDFYYREIGIACSLENDVFSLQGTIVENGIQYLVRRATFFGIDVINGNPVNKISFKDMLERLKRVGQDQEKR